MYDSWFGHRTCSVEWKPTQLTTRMSRSRYLISRNSQRRSIARFCISRNMFTSNFRSMYLVYQCRWCPIIVIVWKWLYVCIMVSWGSARQTSRTWVLWSLHGACINAVVNHLLSSLSSWSARSFAWRPVACGVIASALNGQQRMAWTSTHLGRPLQLAIE